VQLIAGSELINNDSASVTTVVDAAAFQDNNNPVEFCDLVVGDAADGSAAVWGLLENGQLMVTKRKSSTDDPGATWGAQLSLRDNVQEVAPVQGDDHSLTSLFVVYGDSSAGFISQDRRTGVWHERPVHVADPANMQKVTCYATSLRILDESGAPRSGVSVTVSASVLSHVSLNGNSVFLGPSVSRTVTTNTNGSINLYDRAQTLTPAIYRFAFDGFNGYIDINPAGGMHEKFRSMDTRQVQDVSGITDQNKAAAVAGALNQAAQLTVSTDGAKNPVGQTVAGVRQMASSSQTNPLVMLSASQAPGALAAFSSALDPNAVPAGYKWGIHATSNGVIVLKDGDSLIDDLINAGDKIEKFFINIGESIADFFESFWNHVKKAAEDLGNEVIFALHKVGEGVEAAFNFVCKIGDEVKHFVLQTLEEIGHFFVWLWDQVKTALETLWEFLKFLFEWKDILRVRDAMAQATNDGLTYLADSVNGWGAQLTGDFKSVTDTVDSWRQDAMKKYGAIPSKPSLATSGNSFLNSVESVVVSAVEIVDKIHGNCVVAWVVDKVESIFSELIRIEGFDANDVIDPITNFIKGLVGDELNDLLGVVSQLQSDLRAMFDKIPDSKDLSLDTIKEVFVILGADIIEGLLKGVQDFAQRLLSLMGDLFKAMRKLLSARIEFPFIEHLAKLVGVNVDASFSILDALMLVCAIPATIGYKIIFNEAPLKEGDFVTLPFGGKIMVQSGSEAVKQFMKVWPLCAQVLKVIQGGVQIFLLGNVQDPPKWAMPLCGALIVACAAVPEAINFALINQLPKGEQWFAFSLALFSFTQAINLCLLSFAGYKLPGRFSEFQKPSGGLSIALFTAHTAVYIVDKVKFNPPEWFTFTGTVVDNLGTGLISYMPFVKDPKVKLAFAAGGEGFKVLSVIPDIFGLLEQEGVIS